MLSDSYMSTLSLLMAYHVLGSNCFDTSFQQSTVHIENCMANLTNQINVGIQAQNRLITNTMCAQSTSYTPYKKKLTIYDIQKLIFPEDPIRDWVEKKTREIEERYKWVNEL